MLDPLLKEYGLQDSATQALVYFAVAKKVRRLVFSHMLSFLLACWILQSCTPSTMPIHQTTQKMVTL